MKGRPSGGRFRVVEAWNETGATAILDFLKGLRGQLVGRGLRPELARVTVARKIAATT